MNFYIVHAKWYLDGEGEQQDHLLLAAANYTEAVQKMEDSLFGRDLISFTIEELYGNDVGVMYLSEEGLQALKEDFEKHFV